MTYEDFTAEELDEAYGEIAALLNQQRGPTQSGCIQIDPGLYVVHRAKQYTGVPIHFAEHNHIMYCEKDSCWTCYRIAKEQLQFPVHCICVALIFLNERKRENIYKLLTCEIGQKLNDHNRFIIR